MIKQSNLWKGTWASLSWDIMPVQWGVIMKKSYGCIKLIPNKACEIISVINSEAVQLNFSQNILFEMTVSKEKFDFCIKMFSIQIFVSMQHKKKLACLFFLQDEFQIMFISECNPLFADIGPLTVYIVADFYIKCWHIVPVKYRFRKNLWVVAPFCS